MITIEQTREIATEVAAVRVDWEFAAVANVLLGLRDRGTKEQILTAAMRAAQDPQTRAPIAITWAVFWSPKRSTTQSFVVANPLPECRGCGTPRRRNDKNGNPLPPPEWCEVCNEPWQEIHFRVNREQERAEAIPKPPWFPSLQIGGTPE